MPHRLPILLSALIIEACVQPPVEGIADLAGEDDPQVEVADCAILPAWFGSVEAEVTDVATAVRVRWKTDEQSTGYIAYMEEGNRQLRTDVTPEESTSHEFVLRGVHSDSTVYFRLVGEDASGLICSQELTFETGSFGSDLPLLTATEGQAAGTPGYTLLPIITADNSYVAVVDEYGAYVWAARSTEIAWRVRMAQDGRGMLINRQAQALDDDGAVIRLAFDGSSSVEAVIPGGHTDFVELGGGAYAALSWELRDYTYGGETRHSLGDTLLEVRADGRMREVWSTFDSFTPDLSQTWTDSLTDVFGEGIEDWSHANGLSYDADRDQYLVSVTGLDTIVAIDRRSGTVDWAMGGPESTITMPAAESVLNPHSAAWAGDEVLVFNRNDYESSQCSDATRFALDADATTATETLRYEGQDCLSVYYLGEAHPLSDGGMNVAWTTAGRVDQVDSEGSLRWSLGFALGAGVGFTDFTQSLYPVDIGL